jgi:hypothetical protein
MHKLYSVAATLSVAVLISFGTEAGDPDISAQRLLSSWQDGDPGTFDLSVNRRKSPRRLVHRGSDAAQSLPLYQTARRFTSRRQGTTIETPSQVTSPSARRMA